jgi:hypothetical protein
MMMHRSVDVVLATHDPGLDRFVFPVQSVTVAPYSMPNLGAPEAAIIKAAEPPAAFVGPWVMPTFLHLMNSIKVALPLKVGDMLRVGTHGGATPWMRLMEIRTDIHAVYNGTESSIDI